MKQLSREILPQVIRQRPEDSHKGTYGRVVLIGGNSQYGGAIIMSAQAAVASGAGLTTVITEEKNHAPLHARLPEAMVINWYDLELVKTALDTADVVLIGPGLGLENHSRKLLRFVLRNQLENQWVIIDGSAITLLADMAVSLNHPEQIILTPHQKEWERISGLPLAKQTDENNQLTQQKLQASIVVKSHRTRIYTPHNSYLNTVGTPAMATGGTGDTLAGMIAGFIAQFDAKEHALCAAVYLHSLIGEELAKDSYVVLPTSISAHLSSYMKRYEQTSEK
ncbi:NAD(P)H-hydrate dehydratase [Enterococcus sp. LJL128]